jgi:sulfur carrier protein ThiS
MKRSGFKMRSGNGPLAFKLMGSSPVKQEYQADAGTLDADNLSPEVEVSGKKNIADIFKKVDITEKPIYKPRNKQVVNKNQEVSSSDQVKKPGIDTQLVEYVRRKIDERKNKNKIKIEEKNQAKLNSSNNSTEKGTETPKLQEDKTHVIKLDQTIGANQPRKEGYVTEELGPTSDNSGDQSEVKEKEKKKGWKFDIDWDEVGTNAVGAIVTTGIKAGVEALGGNKKPIRKGGSMSGFASQKFSSGSNLFAKKSDDT